MAELRIELLGGFRVSVGDRAVPDRVWHRRKPAALVKLLALAPAHRLHREQIMDALWPELGPAAAAANLRKSLHHARRALAVGDGDGVLSSDVPRGQLTGWLNGIAAWNPVTYVLEGQRSLVTHGWQWADLAKALLAIGVVGLLSMSLCLAALRGRTRRG